MILILETPTLASLLKTMASISMDKCGDTFDLIYDWSGATKSPPQGSPKGKRGGAHQFDTPTSIVKLIVEILEPYHGRILDPACGSGGMFIQSARFVEAHQKNPTAEISIHGLSGYIKQGNPRSQYLRDYACCFALMPAP